jgi:hypothetical protein
MTKHHLKILLAATATAMLATGGVLAATSTNAPGAACVAASGSLSARSDGEIENITGSIATAVCPAERPIGTGGTSKLSATVWVVDQSTAGNVCCKVVSKNTGGAVVQSVPVCSTGASTASQPLSLPQITDTFTFSHFFVQCDVPPINAGSPSRIQMYRTTQE